MLQSGQGDLFIALCVFLPLGTMASAASVGTNLRLLFRQALFRQVQLGGRESVRSPTSVHELQWLVRQYVLYRDEEKHREQTIGYDIGVRQFYSGMLLLFLEVRSIAIQSVVFA